jgi:transcriptional regulator with XRE-family HTH domain
MAKPGEKDPLSVALGGVIATRRREVGLTQEQLASLCKMHPTTISQLERGINSPTVRVLRIIAGSLETQVSALLARAEAAVDMRAG